MCTSLQQYDICGVETAPMGVSSEDSFSPEVCSRLVVAPSLNAILKGTLAPVEDLSEIENNIWSPDTPETFLRASLQFLESKLHNRLYETQPTSSGKVVLSDGFIFSPIYPPSPQVGASESVMKVHSYPSRDSCTKFQNSTDPRVASVMYSCVSIPGEQNSRPISDWPADNYLTVMSWEQHRDVAIQTSNDALTSTKEPSTSMVTDDETTHIGNFSEYVQYCQSIVNPPSQLFNFGRPSFTQKSNSKYCQSIVNPPSQLINIDRPSFKQESSFKFPVEMVGFNNQQMSDVSQTTYDEPLSARTYMSHYRPSSESQAQQSTSVNTILPYNQMVPQVSSGQSVHNCRSNATISSVKSVVSQQTDLQTSSVGTKSVYYYARISASFFSFLNRATQKLKNERNSQTQRKEQDVSSDNNSSISVSRARWNDQPNMSEEEKVTNAKLNVLQRFRNFFGGSKATKEYDKVKNRAGAISTVIDVKTGIFNDDAILEYEHKEQEDKESSLRSRSLSVTNKQWKASPEEGLANPMPCVRSSERKEYEPLEGKSRKFLSRQKRPRYILRDRAYQEDRYSSSTSSPQDLATQQKHVESNCISCKKKKTSTILSTILGSKTSSKTLCDDILKLRLENPPVPTTTDFNHECCMCYNPPQFCSNTGAHEHCHRAQGQEFQSVFCSKNEYICYARVPESDQRSNSTQQQTTDQKQKSKLTETKSSFFKPYIRREKSVQSSKLMQKIGGTVILKQKVPTPRRCFKFSLPRPQDSCTTSTQSQTTATKRNPPLMRKPNTYLIDKPQVFPDKIRRLVSGGHVWTQGTTTPSPSSSIQSYQCPSSQAAVLNTRSINTSEYNYPFSVVNQPASNSSRSSYWIPTKKLACDSRGFHDFQIRQNFSKEVIKLFQRSPKSSKMYRKKW